MRISGGTHRGRLIVVPKAALLRPTTERVREAIFSTLYSMGVVAEARCLDLFAGSGLLGLECLSRGASRAVFVESDRDLAKALEQNLQNLDWSKQGRVVSTSVEKFLRAGAGGASGSFELVLADPPYNEHPGEELLTLLLVGEFLAVGSVVVLEAAANSLQFPVEVMRENLALSLHLQKVKRYGDTEVAYYLASVGAEPTQAESNMAESNMAESTVAESVEETEEDGI